jgi:hypothetical protein
VATKDDDAWRAIIDNYGERVLDDESDADAPAEPEPELRRSIEAVEPLPSWDDDYVDSDWSTDRFVPPPPPPLPTPSTDRMLAWLGIFGSPVVLLVCLVFSIDLPQILAYLLVAAFVGGFLYLVVKMPRGPRDPDDDGAQL